MTTNIRRVVERLAAEAVNTVYESCRANTPVITGVTRDSWYIDVDGVRHFTPVNASDLEGARSIKVRNTQDHIRTLDREYGIIDLALNDLKA